MIFEIENGTKLFCPFCTIASLFNILFSNSNSLIILIFTPFLARLAQGGQREHADGVAKRVGTDRAGDHLHSNPNSAQQRKYHHFRCCAEQCAVADQRVALSSVALQSPPVVLAY